MEIGKKGRLTKRYQGLLERELRLRLRTHRQGIHSSNIAIMEVYGLGTCDFTILYIADHQSAEQSIFRECPRPSLQLSRGHRLNILPPLIESLMRAYHWPGVQLSVVRRKLNVVADVGRRKLSVVTDGTPEKGRRYSTFTHTERALVATFNLSDHTN